MHTAALSVLGRQCTTRSNICVGMNLDLTFSGLKFGVDSARLLQGYVIFTSSPLTG